MDFLIPKILRELEAKVLSFCKTLLSISHLENSNPIVNKGQLYNSILYCVTGEDIYIT
jgi:hypothetical protein